MTQSPPSKAPEVLVPVPGDTPAAEATGPSKKPGRTRAAGVAGAAAVAVVAALVRRKRRAAATPSPWYRRTTGRRTSRR